MYSNAKGGKRKDLNSMYFRSTWEANYARILNLLVKSGEITKWEYETDSFEFHKIKRGIRSYLPDFKLFYTDGSISYVEIKGYMDSRSKTKLYRMNRYYPDVRVDVVGSKEYIALASKYAKSINEWEYGSKGY